MVIISNFNSVLEIAFAFNALFYIFELAPASDGSLGRKLEEYSALVEQKVELTKNSEVFPLGFFVSATYGEYSLILTAISILMSVISLSLLMYTGFYPDATMSNVSMAGLLIILLASVPVSASIIYYKASKSIREATDHLQQIILIARTKSDN